MDENKDKKKQRGIESIAHLFLSELDKHRGGSSNMRTPPGDNSSDNSDQSGQDEVTDFTAGHSNDAGNDSGSGNFDFDLSNSLQGEIVLAYHLRDSYSKVYDYAEYQSQRDERVALVSIDQYEVTLLAVFNSEPIEQPAIIAETEGKAGSLIPLINEAADGFDTIILNVDPSFAPRINDIISHADCVTVITDCTNDGIVSSYQVLKSVAGDIQGDQEISLFVCDAVNEQYADRAYYKFSETARKYIDRTIIPAGCSLLTEPDEVSIEHFPEPEEVNSITADKDESHVDLPQVETGSEQEECQFVQNEIADESTTEAGDIVEENEAYVELQGKSTEDFLAEELIVQPDNNTIYGSVDSVQIDKVSLEEKQDYVEEYPEPQVVNGELTNADKDCIQSGYKPSISACLSDVDGDVPDVKIFKAGQISSLQDLLVSTADSRKAVISRPPNMRQSGPAQVAPVAVKKPLDSDIGIANFVGANLARLSDLRGLVSIELQQFENVFPYARVMVDIEGRVYVVVSVVFADSVAGSVEMVVQWLKDNIGSIATRYRILKIKACLPIQVILIAGTNFNAVYDEALIAADELDADCLVYQLSTFKLGGSDYISLQYG